MVDTEKFYDMLTTSGIDFFAGVPDSLLANLCACIKDRTPESNNIITANEGNAVAMCAGYHISTGKIGCVYMQNSGEGNAVNPLMSLTDEDVYSIPVLLIIGWRGEPGIHDEPQHVKQGKVTLALLEVMGIRYDVLGEDSELQLSCALDYMRTENKPYALIVRKNTFSEYNFVPEKYDFPLTREEALTAIINNMSDDDFIVSTTGKTSREIFEIRENTHKGHANDFLTVGSMGHTASIAYGISLGTAKNVWCIDGDGSFIMHMGGIGVIASKPASNFKYILNVNNAHESVGGQPTCSSNFDIPGILFACGFKTVVTARTKNEISEGVDILRRSSSCALVMYTRQGSRSDLGRPTTMPIENKLSLMKKLNMVQD